LKVCLVVTVKNEAPTLGELLDAIDRQTRAPDEIVCVDGGSDDATLEILEKWGRSRQGVTVVSLPGSNISAGRNRGIELAASPLIAVTDAGCTPEAGWLEQLEEGFAPGVDVAMGFYTGDPTSRFERILACLNLPDAAQVDPGKFMPSSRSIAFSKQVWERAGGYPEWLDIGEDMYFNFRLLEVGARRVFRPGAVVRWRLRSDLASTLRQYLRYAEGDGIAGMYPARHALRLATYSAGAVLAALALRKPAWLAVLVALGGLRMVPAYRRALRRLDPAEAAIALVQLPLLELSIDLAKIAGYLLGRARRVKATGAPPAAAPSSDRIV
jgi:glycosyltransferase involved in cell wall biosynthesis